MNSVLSARRSLKRSAKSLSLGEVSGLRRYSKQPPCSAKSSDFAINRNSLNCLAKSPDFAVIRCTLIWNLIIAKLQTSLSVNFTFIRCNLIWHFNYSEVCNFAKRICRQDLLKKLSFHISELRTWFPGRENIRIYQFVSDGKTEFCIFCNSAKIPFSGLIIVGRLMIFIIDIILFHF